MMSAITPAVLEDLAPQGVLRAAINFGNPVLAQQGQDGSPQGVSVALAKALAQELGVRLEMVTFDAAGKVFAALEEGAGTLRSSPSSPCASNRSRSVRPT